MQDGDSKTNLEEGASRGKEKTKENRVKDTILKVCVWRGMNLCWLVGGELGEKKKCLNCDLKVSLRRE